jgi:hypothetical protein
LKDLEYRRITNKKRLLEQELTVEIQTCQPQIRRKAYLSEKGAAVGVIMFIWKRYGIINNYNFEKE